MSTKTQAQLEQFTVSLSQAMAPLLLAVAIFSLTLLRETANPTRTYTDEIFAFLSGVCLLGSSTSADAALDKYGLTVGERFGFLNLGYLFFCSAIGTLTAAVPILYAETEGRALSPLLYCVFGLTGFFVAAKPMFLSEKYFPLTWSMVISYLLTILGLIFLTHPAVSPSGYTPGHELRPQW